MEMSRTRAVLWSSAGTLAGFAGWLTASAYRCEMYDLMKDLGRYQVTHNPADRNMWRVPGLRNLVYTAPYMHNGSVKSLPEAVRVMASAQLDRKLTEQQVADITAFLQSITGPFPNQVMPRLPPTPGDLLGR